ncbi:hypothetical protein EGH24_03810 [Halonotius terrestris]|uniref:Uncharacterized protein n=1 Tax=Halonotius terrestris TaxID=2487750 RepID=A0A8J8PCC3_9EURY|nr:hypothetical protein [Halonotius terrestris]TQQ82587.1 hypothetical protein EGH24_03810 [Halonotius terrestris]
MVPKSSDKWDDSGKLSRRAALLLIAGGGLLGVTAAGAYDQVSARRLFGIGVDDNNALVGIVDQGPVKRNVRNPMVELTNNAPESVSYTVALSNCSEGALHDNEGEEGCSVTVTLGSGNSGIVDITAKTTGTIGYTVTANGDRFTVETTGSVEAEVGNVTGAVVIQKPVIDPDFTAALPQGNRGNVFEIRNVDIRDNDDDDDLVEVAYEVREGGSNGTLVGEKTVTLEPTAQYSPKGNPAEVVEPNAGYTVQSGQRYTLTVRGTDADGNFATSTVEDTA